MQIKALCNPCAFSKERYRGAITKTLLVMKLTSVLLLVSVLQVAAKSNAQTITYEAKSVRLEAVFSAIEKQTGYFFFYRQEDLANISNVSVSFRNTALDKALAELFKDRQLAFNVQGKAIFITKREPGIDVRKDEEKSPPIDIKGRIVNENGEPVVASIIVKGTSNGTTSNAEGYFELKGIEENAILVISGINIETQEVKAGNKTSLSVVVKIKISENETVTVNAGYYRVTDRERTGSISKVNNETLEKQPVVNVMQALQGRVPGLYIQENSGLPGSNFRVMLRGRNSILNGNNPLYIVDGVPFSLDPLTTTFTSGSNFGNMTDAGGSSPLNILNMAEIESIEVLKDADATAIYGSRGANGVILITTQKGKPGKTNIDVNVLTGVSTIAWKMDLLNSQQYLEVRREAFKNDGVTPTASNAPDLVVWDTTRYTDWQEVLTGSSARFTNAQLNLSGGNAYTQFRFNTGYQQQETVYPGKRGYKRLNSRLNLQHASLDKKFSAGFSISYGADENNLPADNLYGTATTLAPVAPPLYTADGKLNWANSTWVNPLSRMEVKYKAITNNLLTNGTLSYRLMPWLTVKANLGFNDTRFKDQTITPSTSFDPVYNAGAEYASLTLNNSRSQSWIIEPQLSVDKKIASGTLSLLAGTTFQRNSLEQLVQWGTGYTSNELLENLRAAATVQIYTFRKTEYRYSAVFGRLNYNWKGKYIFNGTFRRDGSSRFGPGRQFANFGAAGAAWIFSEEPFMINKLPFVSFGKLRASYGTSGNDQIADYGYLDTYGVTAAYFGVAGLAPQRLFNPDYAWEINKKMEIGIELGFLKDRIRLSAGYYRNRSSNQLVGYPLPATTGFTSIQANLAATVQNTGLEMELNTVNIHTGSFDWSTSFNLTAPRNKLISFPGLEKSTYASRYIIGEPITISRRYVLLGVDPQTGIYQFKDMNNDGTISSADRLAFRNIGQQYYGGLNNSVRLKNWQFDIFFQFVKQTGNSFFYSYFTYPGRRGQFPAAILEGRWQKPGDIAVLQKYSQSNAAVSTAQSNFSDSDATVVDASFVRLKNISISYNIPQQWIKIKGRVYLQGQNLLTFTNYTGADPENNYSSTHPPLRTLTAGIQINL